MLEPNGKLLPVATISDTMPVNGIIDLVTALERHNFTAIEGTPECDWVDFKRLAYPTDSQRPLRLTERGKWELCKDVAAFANGSGGCLVLGFPEVTDLTLGVKVAGPIAPIAVESVDLAHYRDVLERGVYPVPLGVEMRWFAVPAIDPAAGALLIHVPPAADRPLLLRKVVSDQGELVQAVGVPVRNVDRTNWYMPERVHHLLRQGERMSAPVETQRQREDHDSVWQRADDNISELLRLQEWDDEPVLFLQAVPVAGPSRLAEFFDVVKDQLERPPSIRPLGFSLRSLGGVADHVAGGLLVRRMDEAAARLDPDGLLTLGGLVSPDFLGWAFNKTSTGMMRINSTALVELTVEFCRFVNDVLRPRAGAAEWTYRACCRLFERHHVALAPGFPPTAGAKWDWNVATTDHWDRRVPASNISTRDAFDLASDIYALFGLPESAIPYSDGREISIEKIRSLDGQSH